jgi:hypothetical protein
MPKLGVEICSTGTLTGGGEHGTVTYQYFIIYQVPVPIPLPEFVLPVPVVFHYE